MLLLLLLMGATAARGPVPLLAAVETDDHQILRQPASMLALNFLPGADRCCPSLLGLR